jgi:hypothetical protein
MKQSVRRSSSWFSWLFGFRNEPQPAHVKYIPLELCETELNSIKTLLGAMLVDGVFSTRKDNGYGVRIHTADETIAYIGIFPKGGVQNQICIKIEIEDQHKHLKPWFQAAFFGFIVKFTEPALPLLSSWIEKPRE